ncbi:hypothetical protein [Butyrivibrio sp. MC2013]|uniref:hypothetical protein n=1 Tax=Butyrivibrio sp. MC2013 TaxID=1280686 RepID=UPI000429714F|nr:hypothetical protein [Butyrivibrio sp. MC2013]
MKKEIKCNNTLFQKYKNNLFAVSVILFFAVYFLAGIMAYKDYGISTDEAVQRRHSLVTYKYINEVIFDRKIDQLSEYPSLEEYNSYYGVALQLPLVLIEDLYNFSLPTRTVYLIRHLATFLICYIGYVFYYFSLKQLFTHNRIVPIIGTAMLMLYPRFFAMQFFDIKNLVFAAINMIVVFFMINSIEHPKAINQILLGASIALAVNTRFMAISFLALMIGYYLLTDITAFISEKRNAQSILSFNLVYKYVILSLSFTFFWYLITPKAWKNPFGTFSKTYETFSNYDIWDKTMLFMGRLITCDEMPWYYLFVWFGISIPILYIVFFVFGHVLSIKDWIQSGHSWSALITKYKWHVCFIALFWGNVLAVILMHSRIYIGWHHMYYVFVFFCTLTCFGINYFYEKRNTRHIVVGICFVYILIQAAWIMSNHPHEGAYLNIIGRPVGDQFDREEWRTTSYEAINWILKREDGQFSLKGGSRTIDLLTDDDKKRIIPEETPKYIICDYRNIKGNDIEYQGYEEQYTVWVDGYKICSVFQKK